MIAKAKKVFVGISGGVDSSVSAALLLKAGYDVTGVFIEVWQPPFLECTSKDDRRDAMRVCAKLGIPFLLCDAREAYKREVVDYLVKEYSEGRTPNPDVMCNRAVKFGVFFDFAMSLGADFVATGHYAQIIDGSLSVAVDQAKDQSYFLAQVPRDRLSKTIFPIGHLAKVEVRKLASKFKLHTASKKDSQGLCFMGKLSMKDFLKEILNLNEEKLEKGKVLDKNGQVIGDHDGAIFYTIGERHGFRVPTSESNHSPLYVVSKDMQNNTITVGERGEGIQSVYEIVLERCNLIQDEKLFYSLESDLVYRYHGERVPCRVLLEDGSTKIMLERGLSDVAQGQIAVIYRGELCLGSGVIAETR